MNGLPPFLLPSCRRIPISIQSMSCFSKGSDNYGNSCIMDERTENWEVLKHV